jgi:hypothetical protein
VSDRRTADVSSRLSGIESPARNVQRRLSADGIHNVSLSPFNDLVVYFNFFLVSSARVQAERRVGLTLIMTRTTLSAARKCLLGGYVDIARHFECETI